MCLESKFLIGLAFNVMKGAINHTLIEDAILNRPKIVNDNSAIYHILSLNANKLNTFYPNISWHMRDLPKQQRAGT